MRRRAFWVRCVAALAGVLSGCSVLTDLDGLSSGGAGGDADSGDADRGSDATNGDADPARLDGGPDGTTSDDAGKDAARDGGADATCDATSTGLTSGTIAATAPGGDAPWATTNGALAPGDSILAVATISSADEKSSRLVVRGFGLAIPAQAVVLDVTVEVMRYGIDHEDENLRLVMWNGSGSPAYGTGDRKAGDWPTALAARSYGGTVAQWGMALTPATVSSPEFGVALSAKYKGLTTGDAFVDSIRVSVRYCE